MITVRLKLFASIRDICGFSEQEISLEKPVSVNFIIQELTEKHPELSARKYNLLIAVNEDYTDAGTILKNGDTVALFPPVSGG